MNDDEEHQRMVALCRPCNAEMQTVVTEYLGDVYWCRGCGCFIEINRTKPSIIFDIIKPNTTGENGHVGKH